MTPNRCLITPRLVVLQEGTAMDKSVDSLFAIESVKVQTGRPNLPAMLRDEMEMATGRMSVNVCGSQGIVRSVHHALQIPMFGPLSVANWRPKCYSTHRVLW
ncbi:uncharacterized protein EDB91DRAFT_140108 [Suillus paluster]|uniref:uncharacterized protein n=1 Tax=Suillus paluster TaxID=48578 RepID=UPI001B87E616|nr:uncharacterized protein EDB91DRAFT_140108 [Suillus paluster]KAG1746048.1 hypothetical protein EDB91DRAFT_140108 [Suillus paluster]